MATSAETKTVTPSTFIKKFRAHMRDLTVTADAARIDALQDYLEENSPVEKWYKDLQASANPATTWAAMEAAFLARFPGPEKAERTAQEWERELASLKLTVEELGTTVKVSSADVFAHVHFAGRLLEIAKLAKIDGTTSGIWQARDALPEVIRDKVPSTQTDWTTFTAAIKAVDRIHIKEGVAKAKKVQEMECTLNDLTKNRTPPMTPVSKMAGQLSRTALGTPKAPTGPVAPAGGNPFASGGGRGNLFGGQQQQNLDENAKARLREVAGRLARSLLRDDAEGRAEYARRVGLWNAAHREGKVLLEQVGYLLSPGTAAPCSGECFGCGKVTTPWHRKSECPGPAIPPKETTFRSICMRNIAAKAVPVNVVAEWMDFGDVEEEDFVAGSSG
ncbi:hypothetical protein C8R44DRAFT_631597 [Mycena epipterygia]|nr:hypothetical protein C8R44DRAFT_631597 [Mycena epipterygia]